MSYAEALAEMQRRGLAETDPSLDVEGWDAANKLTIIANALRVADHLLARHGAPARALAGVGA